jgi:anti-sigma factor RsiW
MTRGRSARLQTIEEVRARFEQWRQTRQRKTRIPEELWSAAAEVARREGVSRTAAALGLDGAKLKRRMLGSAAKAPAPAFVELIASAAAPGRARPEYTIELEGRNGKLRIHCSGATASELAELSLALWDMAS